MQRGSQEEARPITQHSIQATRAASRVRVLVAEDNAVNQKLAAKMLENLGYRADLAADGKEAVEAITRIPYAAVLMDVQMPDMDGYTATAEIRRREGPERHTPIIAMTANAMQGDREKAIEAGMDDYVPKPVKLGELEAVLGRWASRVEEDLVGEEPEEEPLDRSALAVLRELQQEGQPNILEQLITLFLDDVPHQLVALRNAAEAGDARSVERTAHTLKGSCGNMGAVRMHTLCAELEYTGRSAELDTVPVRISRLEEEFGHVRAALVQELSKR
jgi:two-component system sensor histidine kinase/response regulator